MRLFFINMHRLWGGQSAVVLLLGEELHRRGHEVVIAGVAGSELIKRAQNAGLKTFDTLELVRGFRPLSFWRDQRRLKKYWREFKPDILLTNGSQDTWSCALARSKNLKLVRWRHNSFAVGNHLFNRWLYRSLIDHIVVSSGAIAPLLTNTGLVEAKRITVFPPTTPIEKFLNAKQNRNGALRQELGLNSDDLLTLSVGRLAPEKGHANLVRAWKAVSAEIPHARLAIVGLGSQEKPLRTLIDSLKLEKYVFLTGFRDDIPLLYGESDLAALTPIAGESFGIALLEAFASGRACVATDVGGVGDLVLDGKTGFLVKAADEPAIASAVIKCLKDSALRERLAIEGKARVLANFTPEKLADTAETLFKQLIS